jgi:hypothetical protein
LDWCPLLKTTSLDSVENCVADDVASLKAVSSQMNVPNIVCCTFMNTQATKHKPNEIIVSIKPRNHEQTF